MNDYTERQKRLLIELESSDGAVSGSELADRCEVTRQVVVHDIAILRAKGEPIVSTPRGYMFLKNNGTLTRKQYVLSVYHTPDLVGRELEILVDYGFRIKDVVVEHPLYGELRGSLLLSSRRDVEIFLQKSLSSNGTLLSNLTGGYHLHTIESDSLDHLPDAITELRKNRIQVFD
jgi:uncharacterized protein